MKFFKSLYIHNRFFIYISVISALFLVSFWIPALYKVTWMLVWLFATAMCIDVLILYRFKNGFSAKRMAPEKLSNSDDNEIAITLENNYPFQVFISLIDELPVQFQKRDFEYTKSMKSGEKSTYTYTVRPVERGAYTFGRVNVFVSSFLQLFSKRYAFSAEENVKVYPSYLQMKKYEFLAMHNNLTEFGMKKIRRIGHTMEFEQIKNYIPGDDVRTINWKATAKRGELMVNQYQDEKSQPIYSIIDLGRVMKMPFDGLKLLDYAINATLAFSNIALLKNDKAGMLTFSKKVEKIVAASNKKTNLSVINEELYNITTDFSDASFALLYANIKRKINQRSLLILYTNFEHISGLKRQLPYLKAIAKKHLLVTVFFENTELDTLITEHAEDLQSVYHKTIAEKYAYEKRLMIKELEKNAIHAILTKPQHLSVNVINKYLEFKAKGMV
ncbi:DUF58 domain-containing protein [Tenacibaculum tangerinum]|uniref:DUF58 domain-containing protein n=1 Tax=Tenacibaculum tangerinum TaxID=3038772 RepID=A0ABY8LA68_9FLAO|nr:DUF58 domain-containing protein [Tenacibaculum tangerinum]WGH77053.1 DUF58 domain-containing protein [Tenacibaculum tangerinum]